MIDSLIEAILAEPERFLGYIKNWRNIFTLKDFMKAIKKSFGFHHTGKNIYKSDKVKNALEILWKNKYTQYRVKRNYDRLKKKYEEIEFEKEFKEERRKIYEIKYGIKKEITVTKKDGTTYKKSYNRWADRESEWLSKNKNIKPSLLTDLFNAVFRPRTKSSIVGKRRRI